jgi:hypothetical protein
MGLEKTRRFKRIELFAPEPPGGLIFDDGEPLSFDFLFDVSVLDNPEKELKRSFFWGSGAGDKEPQVMKNPKTGEEGYWITIKGGRRVFVPNKKKSSPEAVAAKPTEGEKPTQPPKKKDGFIKRLIKAILMYYVYYYTFLLGFAGLFVGGVAAHKGIQNLSRKNQSRAILKLQWLKKNADRVKEWEQFPFKNSAEGGLGIVPQSLDFAREYKQDPFSEGFKNLQRMDLPTTTANFDMYPKGGLRSLGHLSVTRTATKKHAVEILESSITLQKSEKLRSRFAGSFKNLQKDLYELAQKDGARYLDVRAKGEQGAGLASIGYNWADVKDADILRNKGAGWVRSPEITTIGSKGQIIKEPIELTQEQKDTLFAQIENSKTAADQASITIDHPQYGKIYVGREYMKEYDWLGRIDISTDNPQHRMLHTWLYGGEKPIKLSTPRLTEDEAVKMASKNRASKKKHKYSKSAERLGLTPEELEEMEAKILEDFGSDSEFFKKFTEQMFPGWRPGTIPGEIGYKSWFDLMKDMEKARRGGLR